MKGAPKSETSTRKVAIPDLIIPDLRRHLEEYAAPGPDGFVFVGVRGNQLRRSNFTDPWRRALDAAGGLPEGIHLHDLRHTGNTFAAESGASLAELMSRMGHSSTRAARIYLHARQERDKEIAATLGKMVRRELKRSQKPQKSGDAGGGKPDERSGTQRARKRRKAS
ncbi:tyrosine-type recombinase/integrase [Actinoallomurus sp. CA-150999]|uniref:tyrosine-type recombinase/integrase n=1 Tax=Actinoallomurus sp. CA-150999 TaxID=3239887 RepID=UPI003D8C6BE8